MHASELVAVAIVAAVGAVSLVLALLAWKAFHTTGNPKLAWVVAAFTTFLVKSAFTATALVTHVPAHEHLEIIGSVFDLLVLSLLVAPFVLRP